MWDLQQNGGNVAATTERILGGRLDMVCCHITSRPHILSKAPPTLYLASANISACPSGSQHYISFRNFNAEGGLS